MGQGRKERRVKMVVLDKLEQLDSPDHLCVINHYGTCQNAKYTSDLCPQGAPGDPGAAGLPGEPGAPVSEH